MSLLGELIVKITGDASPLSAAIKKADKSMKDFDDKLKKTGGQIKKFGGDLTMVASAPVLGLFITSLGKLKNSTDPAAKSLKDIDATIGSLQMEIGKALIPIIQQASNVIKGFADWFKNLSDSQKQNVVNIGLLVAAIGPLMAIFGTLLSLGIPGLILGIAAAIGGLIIAANSGSEANIKYYESSKKVQEGLEGELALMQQEIDQRERLLALVKKDTTAELEAFKQGKATLDQALKIIDKKIEIEKSKPAFAQSLTIINALYKERNDILAEQKRMTKETADLAIAKEQELQSAFDKNRTSYIMAEQYKWEQIGLYSDSYAEKEKANLQKMQDEYKAAAEAIISTWSPVAEAFGAALVTGEDGWVMFKKAGLAAVASLIESLAKMWALEGVAALVPGFGFNPAAAVGWFAASAAGYVAAGVVRNLKDGGLIMPQPGGSIVRIAEAGVPEYAVPERRDYLTRLADRITENMNRPIVNNFNPSMQMPNGITVKIGEREFYGLLTDASRNGRFVVDPIRGVAKR